MKSNLESESLQMNEMEKMNRMLVDLSKANQKEVTTTKKWQVRPQTA